MPVVDINPNNSGTIKLGIVSPPTQEYACQVIEFTLNPVQKTSTREETFCEAESVLAKKSGWEISFRYLQDWGSATSISKFMTDNDGKPVFFEFAPDDPDVDVAAGSFNAVASSYGGPAGASWTSTGTVGLIGAPTFTAPVVAFDTDDDTDTE